MPSLENLGCQADDFHEILLAQLAGDRPEDACTAWVELVVDDDGGVLVEADQRAVVATVGLLRPDDDGFHHLALLDRALRRRGLHGSNDDVADAGIATVRSSHHADAEDLAGAGVVGDLEAALLLDHFATSTISVRRQRFVADSGRVSTMRTVSPTWALFVSSWAWNLTDRRTTFLYFRCDLITSTLTTIVLSIASETTVPRRSWLRPRSCSGFSSRTIGRRSAGRSRFGLECLWRSERGMRLRFCLRAGSAGAASSAPSAGSSADCGSPSAAGSS